MLLKVLLVSVAVFKLLINIKMTNKKFITEGLDFHAMEGQVIPTISVDEYAAKMGENSDIVTLSFTVKSEAAGNDLVDWFERGYDWVLDAQVSEGELESNRWLVFVEINRRSTVPERIVELLKDLKTLTNLKVTEWTVQVDDEDYDPDEKILQQVIVCNPNRYKMEKEKEGDLNEMRGIAGLDSKKIFVDDEYTKGIKNLAGI
jgi:hypothetical protein